MDLDGARNAKADIFRQAFGFEEQAGAARAGPLPRFGPRFALESIGDLTSGFGTSMGVAPSRRPAAPRMLPQIAVGIRLPERGGDGAHRVILMGEKRSMRHHPVVERAIALAAGECDYLVCGRNRPFSFWQPPRCRPVAPGASVAHSVVGAGTLGAFVELGDGLGILSNNHVLAAVNRGTRGDHILQPGRRDGGVNPADLVGTLERFVPIDATAGAINFVDCAVARLDPTVQPSNAFMGAAPPAGPPPLAGVDTSDIDAREPVSKVGRTTGFTRGRVFAVEVDNHIVNFGPPGQPVRARFDDQFQVEADVGPFARPGDSGAIVMDADGNARGLLFSGSTTGGPNGLGLTTVNPIGTVLEKLDVQLWLG